MSITYMDKWHLHEDGCLEMEFRDGSHMKLMSSKVVAISELNVIWTESGNGYIVGQPLYNDIWPGHVPASTINEALYLSVHCFEDRGLDGHHLWEMFQDELATLFATYK